RQTARPGKPIARSKTAPGIFWLHRPETRPESLLQLTETHQESATYVFVFVPGCAVAPNSATSTSPYTQAMMYIAGYGPNSSGFVGGYGTLAIGYNQSGTAVASISQTTGLVIDSNGQVGLFQTNSGGGGIGANEGIGLFVGISNAQNIDNYKSFSADFSVSGGYIVGGTFDSSFAPSGGGPNGTQMFEEHGFTFGEDTGLSAQGYGSYTTVVPLFQIPNVTKYAPCCFHSWSCSSTRPYHLPLPATTMWSGGRLRLISGFHSTEISEEPQNSNRTLRSSHWQNLG
ncbi:MAG: hypothetical protein ACREFX_15540, partial [Opitutaceae bacterium]